MPALLGDVVRAALLLGVARAILYAARGRSASLRRLVLVGALAGTLLMPLISRALALTGAAGLAELRFDAGAVPLLDVGPDAAEDPAPLLAPPASAPAIAAAPPPVPRSRPLRWIVGVWLAGASLVVIRWLTAELAVRRLVRGARAPEGEPPGLLQRAEVAIGARGRVLVSDRIGVPLTAGVLRPVILLPAGAASWTRQRWEVVLRHELSHVRQRDVLAQRVAELVCACHWFNPLAWWARARLESERELAADERVVESGLVASSYAGELLRVAAEQAGHELPARALAAAQKRGLSERVERLVSSGAHPLPSGPRSALSAFGIVALACFFACASVSSGEAAAPRAKNDSGAVPAPGLAEQAARVLGTPAQGITLTIDPRIQAIAEAETARELSRAGTRAATVIVIEPSSGHLLALTGPRTATASYAPGSTLKTLTFAAALEAGKLALDQKFDCGSGFREYENGQRLRDHGSYGWLDARQILIRSSNVGASRIYDLVGGSEFTRWFARFHLDQPTQVELPDRAPGFAGDVAKEPAGSLRGAIAALGAGVATSPLQIAALYAALANDGVYNAPTLVARAHVPKPERLLRSETARALLTLLIGAVEDPEATGRAARLPGVSVAGKTGSAQVKPVGPGVGEGDSPAYVSFVGIVPATAPRYVILVGVEGADPEASGGKVAAPAFARIAERVLASR